MYRFESEDTPPLKMRLKIEVNTREHFTELGLASVPFEVDSPWFRGSAEVHTFALDELLGTKLRALYQRKKGQGATCSISGTPWKQDPSTHR